MTNTVPSGAVVAACPEESAERLQALGRTVSSCAACPRLVAWREEVALAAPRSFAGSDYWSRPLAGYGDPAARLVVVGLAPAAHGGNRTGRMFTGDRSGDFLVDGLHEHGFANQATSRHRDDGLRLTGAWLTAPVKCAPPANRPLTEERDRCLPFLKEELSLLVSARVYLALGAYAFEALRRLPDFRPPLTGQRFAHGAEHSLAGGRKALLCSYHPSQRNVFTGKLTREMFSAVLRRAREIAYG